MELSLPAINIEELKRLQLGQRNLLLSCSKLNCGHKQSHTCRRTLKMGNNTFTTDKFPTSGVKSVKVINGYVVSTLRNR